LAALADGCAKLDDGERLKLLQAKGLIERGDASAQVARAGLTAEEIADLLNPGPVMRCERWVKPLARREATSSARFG
jgi:hypothetical protein